MDCWDLASSLQYDSHQMNGEVVEVVGGLSPRVEWAFVVEGVV